MSGESGVLYSASAGASAAASVSVPASALRTPSEEFLSALTHGVGMLLSIVAGVTLVHIAGDGGDWRCMAACGFYAATLISVYTASTLSHLYVPEHLNRWFRSLDQGCIYLLIVGSFTPFAIRYLSGSAWIWFWGLCLAIAVVGFFSKTVFTHRLLDVSVWLYIALGWCEAIAVFPMLGRAPAGALIWMGIGGLSYTIGTIFLVVDIRRYHFHAIWHLLVMVGSACHFFAILRYVAAA